MIASTKFNFWNEQGSFVLAGNHYRIEHAWLSAEWSLNLEGEAVALAVKPNPLTRFFEVFYANQKLVLRAESPLTRTFLIEQDEQVLGTIQPMHLFTRRALVDCSSSVAMPVQIFLFWLTVLMWKRAANNSTARGGAAGGSGC